MGAVTLAVACAAASFGCERRPLDAVTINPASLSRDLVAHWRFDEGSGATATDSSGNAHHGVLTGGTWITSGRFGGALSLASGDFVSVPSFPQADVGWTVSIWVRSSAAGLAASTSDLSTLIGTENVFAGGWQLHLDNRPNYQRFDAAYWAGASDYVVAICQCLEPDRWLHLAAVWDGERATLTLYRNGEPVDDRPMPTPILTGDTTLYMGTWMQLNRFLIADLDDVAIWRRALLSLEIETLSRQPPGE